MPCDSLSAPLPLVAAGGGLGAKGKRREREEVGLTLLFLATLAIRILDDSEGQERTHAFL